MSEILVYCQKFCHYVVMADIEIVTKNLRAEIARYQVPTEELRKVLGLKRNSSVLGRLKGKPAVTIPELEVIADHIGISSSVFYTGVGGGAKNETE